MPEGVVCGCADEACRGGREEGLVGGLEDLVGG